MLLLVMTKIQLYPSVPHPNATFEELPRFAAFTFGPNPPQVWVKVGDHSAIGFEPEGIDDGVFSGEEPVFFLELLTIEAVVRPF